MLLLNKLKAHTVLLAILALYTILAGLHSLTAPLTTGNDEWAHFLYVRFIAREGHLPETPAERELAGYKSDAPPLYHLLVGAVTAGLEPVSLLRPLDTPWRYLADNLVDSYALVHTAVEQFPYRGEVLLWHLGRFLSIFFGLALISLTYLTCQALFPERPAWAGLAAGLVAFTPAVLFHSSVLSYESLSATLTALFLLIAVKAIQQPQRRHWWLALGAVAGLALTTKYSAALLPLEIVFVAWLAARREQGNRSAGVQETTSHTSRLMSHIPRTTHDALRSTFYATLALLLTSSWWFGFVIYHFNTVESQGLVVGILQPLLVGDASDTTSVNVAGFLFGQEEEGRPPLARNYPRLLLALLESFWSAPVAGHFILSPWLPLLFSLGALAALLGLIHAWRGMTTPAQRTWLWLLLFHAGLILPLLLIRVVFSYDPREVAQGRHILLPAASAIAILLVWGWDQGSPKIAPPFVAGLFLWSGLGQLGWASLVYPPPLPVWPETAAAPVPVTAQPQTLVFLERMQLKALAWYQEAEVLEVTLWWEALALAAEDNLVEISLVDEAGRTLGYSLGHPAQGRYPTRAWEPGDTIQDIHRLPLSPVAAGDYRLQLRLFNRSGQPVSGPEIVGGVNLAEPVEEGVPCRTWPEATLTRSQVLRPNATLLVMAETEPILTLNREPELRVEQHPWLSQGNFHAFIVEADWPPSAQLWLGPTLCGTFTFDIPLRNFTVPPLPQPLAANFNNEIELLGYELPTRRIEPGGRLPLTLYWRALAYMGEDYRLFANPLDQAQQRWGGYDRQPRDGYSTLRWVPGEIITDPFGIPIDPTAPPGIYTLDIGFYREGEAGAESLPLVREGQVLEQRSLRLGPIKVGGPPPGVVVSKADPQIELRQTLGDQIMLLGYSLLNEARTPVPHPTSETLRLRLFWQADTVPQADYTVFFHLRDAANHTVAQQDGPPAAGRYPTGLWDPGEIIIDEITLSLAGLPPGQYTPVLGLYNLATGDRLLTPDNPANEISLEPIEVP